MTKYILGKNASVFWDASQTKKENQCLRPGEVKELEETPKVETALRHNGILLANEKNLKEAGIDLALLEGTPKAEAPKKVAAKDKKVADKEPEASNETPE